jgi:uncharacterized membrane-anchored protein
MRTIIEAPHVARRLVVGSAAVLFVWFGGMAALVFFVEPPALIAFGPKAQLIQAAVKADASILAIGKGFVTASAGRGGLARRLYASGAWFVWPALQPSCGRRG